jgi:hypothetical protein
MRNNKDEGGCSTKLVFIVLGVLVAIATVTTVGIGSVLTTQKDSVHRVVVDARASNVFPAGAGEGNQQATCKITLDENYNSISFRCRTPPGLSAVTALHIRGPILLGNLTWSGAVAGVLCGAVVGPGDGCNVLTVPGELSGSVSYEISDNSAATGQDVRPLLHAIRRDPDLFYLEVLTNAKPNSPGALRGSFSNFAGWE